MDPIDPIDRLVQLAAEALRAHGGGDPDAAGLVATAIVALDDAMRDTPATRVRLGPLLGRLRRTARTTTEPSSTRSNWVPVAGGRLAVGHRPRLRALAALRRSGATHILTLTSESEGARDIERSARDAGLRWLWLPLANGEPPEAARIPVIASMFLGVSEVLAQGGAVFAHCSAGIHRTGMITFALLRYLGHGTVAARELMAALRTVTAERVGARRLEWGDGFGLVGARHRAAHRWRCEGMSGLTAHAKNMLAIMRAAGERGRRHGHAWDPEWIAGVPFESYPDVAGLLELEAAGLVEIDVYDPRCGSIGARLTAPREPDAGSNRTGEKPHGGDADPARG
ncbi:MAG: tyrosine-protein phosphatase [Planctomycetes bacterium]|nr:tyrosine-protein phosphatase [Planctomycetota bacterium]